MKNLFEFDSQDVDISISVNSNEKDSDGNILTNSQSSYFKNSVVRDSSSRLQVCYHGSKNDFNVFDTEHKRKWPFPMLLDFGTHFTEDKSFASRYGGIIYKCYLNITNPYMMTSIDAWEGAEPTMSDLLSKGYDGVIYRPIHRWSEIAIESEVDSKYNFNSKVKEFISRDKIVRKTDRKDDLQPGQCWIDEECLDDAICYIVFNSKQIKRISNTDPTKSSNIDEDYGYPQPDKGFYDIKGNEATWNQKGQDWIYWGSESRFNDKYAQAYRCKMSPKDFLDLTTNEGADKLYKGYELDGFKLDDLDINKLNSENYQNIYLRISFDKYSKKTLAANRQTKEFEADVIGHEGRHRMWALWQSGVTSVDVELRIVGETKYDRYNPFEIDRLTLSGQFKKSRKVVINNPIAITYGHHKVVNPSIQSKNESLNEEYLIEVSRRQLIDKSKKSDRYKDTSRGKNRWERKKFSKIATSVSQYNNINMDAFFKRDILTVGINVHGETSNYVVLMKFEKMLENIQKEIKRNNNKLEFKIILVALTNAFNNGNVYVHCTCPDYTYRGNYWATVNGYEASTPQTSNGMKIQNPNDTKGAGCKHVMLVLSNVNWIMKVASVINNYIKYAEEHMQKAYADIIFPKLYGMKYDRAVQLGLFDSDDLDTSKQTIDIANKIGKNRGRFSSANQPTKNKGNNSTQQTTNSKVVGTNKKELNTSIDDEI